MSDKYIQLKNPQGDYLYPRTDWSMILNAPGVPSVALVNSKQDQLTASNAGSNISITTVNGVLKINCIANTMYEQLSHLPQLNGVTIQGQQYPYTFNLVSYDPVGRDNYVIKGPNGVTLMTIQNGNIITSAFDSRVTITNVSSLTNDAGYITASYHDSQKQDVLTSANAGSNVTITTVNGVLKINSTASGGTTNYTALTNLPSINNITVTGDQTAAHYKLVKVVTQSGTTSFYDDSNNVAFTINNGYLSSTNFDSQSVLNRITTLEGSNFVTETTLNSAIAQCAKINNMPVATASTLGCIKVGTHLSISNGVLSVNGLTEQDIGWVTTDSRYSNKGAINAPDLGLGIERTGDIFTGLSSNMVTIQYWDTDAATPTWVDYGLTTAQKLRLFSRCATSNRTSVCLHPGKINTEMPAAAKVRFIFNFMPNNPSSPNPRLYGRLRKIAIYNTDPDGSVKLNIWGQTFKDVVDGAQETLIVENYEISGNSGLNVVNIDKVIGNSATTGSNQKNYQKLILEFSHTTATTNIYKIHSIMGYCSMIWANNGSLEAIYGHAYTIDYDKSVSFPAALTTVGAITSQSTITAVGDISTSGTITGNNIPAPPSANGTYYLKCVKTSNSTTYSWTTLS